MERFGLEESSRSVASNGDKECRLEVGDEELLGKEGATDCRWVAARFSFLSLDCPDLQFPSKACSREMAKPCFGSWKVVKKLARYLVGRGSVVWKFEWQEEVARSEVDADSDWGGNSKDRRSTSGGVWRLGKHTIKTWSATQGAYALSSAEAELYGMVEGVTRAKGLVSLAKELGFDGLSTVLRLGTDSSAAKSFVCRRGLGKMRHVEIRDLWLQKEVAEGNRVVEKIPGLANPADLMTKVLSLKEVVASLGVMGMSVRGGVGGEEAERFTKEGGNQNSHPV